MDRQQNQHQLFAVLVHNTRFKSLLLAGHVDYSWGASTENGILSAIRQREAITLQEDSARCSFRGYVAPQGQPAGCTGNAEPQGQAKCRGRQDSPGTFYAVCVLHTTHFRSDAASKHTSSFCNISECCVRLLCCMNKVWTMANHHGPQEGS